MRRFLRASWKHAVLTLVVFSFVGLGAAATSKAAAPKGKHEGKTVKSETVKTNKRHKNKKKTQAEIHGNRADAAASEAQNEQDESAVEGAESTREGLEEKSETDEG